jgi:hypothetical protein
MDRSDVTVLMQQSIDLARTPAAHAIRRSGGVGDLSRTALRSGDEFG